MKRYRSRTLRFVGVTVCLLFAVSAKADECDGMPDGTPCTSDGNPCTGDFCVGGVCTHIPLPAGTVCDDGKECTTPDTCNAVGTCVGVNVPNGTQCTVDGNLCTDEKCNGAGDCVANCIVGRICVVPGGGPGVCIVAGMACPCAPTGGCCLPERGTCAELIESECLAAGGDYLGDGTGCSPNMCSGVGIPTVSEWGLVVLTLLAMTTGTIVYGRRRTVPS